MNRSVFNANLTALRKHPHLVKVVERMAGSPLPDGYHLETSRSGHPTLSVVLPNGKVIAFHSRFDPKTEAARQVDAALQGQSHVLLFGLGLGYTLEEILSRLPRPGLDHQVMIVEPDPLVFHAALLSRDCRALLQDSRVDWWVGQTPDQVGDNWTATLDWTALENLAVVEHAPTITRFAGYFEDLKEKIRYLCQRSKGNLVTMMHTGVDFHANNFANLHALATYPGVGRLFNRFAQVPAIVVAAGPSLERNIHLLAEIRDRFLIIATDTSLRQLVAHGIRPHLVCAADPSYENSLDFVGVENETGVILAIEPMTHPDILHSFTGPKMVMTFGSGLASLVEPHREPLGKLLSWGSIATTAFDMARQFGCDPIVFIGLDLSFQDGRLYARGSYSDDLFYDRVHPLTSLEHETIDYIAERGVFRIPVDSGEVLFTDRNMNLYRGWFEDQFQKTRQTVINATEGGVVSRFVKCQPLEQVIREYGSHGKHIGEILQEALAVPATSDLEKIHGQFADLLKELRGHQDLVQEGLACCRKLAQTDGAIPCADLTGLPRIQCNDAQRIHDRVLDNPTITGWFTNHSARFLTRHTMEIRKLKAQTNVTVGEWVEELRRFFEAMDRFQEFQIPVLAEGLATLPGKFPPMGQPRPAEASPGKGGAAWHR
jgi:hypothetical protein